jgi:hypothetical protein
MNLETGLVPLYYMPPISVFKQLICFPALDFQTQFPFEKMSFRNRCIISGSQGMQTLSIPIQGGRGIRAPYTDVIMDNRQPWHLHHWRAIYSAYGRSPWFEYYASELEELYASPPDRLVDWNFRCLDWLFGKLGIPTPEIIISGKHEQSKHPGLELKNNSHLSPQQFKQGSLDGFPKYTQVFQDKNGFIPNLSMLDYILCAGPRSVRDWIMRPLPA